MRLRVRELVLRAIEEGLARGLRRSYKYDDTPRGEDDWTEERRQVLLDNIMGDLDEIVHEWGDEVRD